MRHAILVLLVSLLLALCPSAAFPMGAGGGGGGGSAGAGGGSSGSAGGDHRDQQGAKVPTRSQSGDASGKQGKYGRE
jgi:hypothetical protein